jgi:hypothetical protein
LAADRDQAASDRDLTAGVDARAHELSRGMRERSAVQREQSAQARVDAAHDRDRIARVGLPVVMEQERTLSLAGLPASGPRGEKR